MVLDIFTLVLAFVNAPINTLTMNNVGSIYDYTYNEITLFNNLIVNNSIYFTDDIFQMSWNINLDDYATNDIIGRIDLYIGTDYLYVDNDAFYFEVYQQLIIYDLDYEVYDNVSLNFEYDEVLAESYMTNFAYVNPKVEITTTLYDKSKNYEQGFIDGKQEGSEQGYDIGYEEGKIEGLEQGRTEGQGVNNVITWFGSVWDGLARILSLEVAPNLTIGTIITIPIVIAVLFFGLKALIQ